MKLIYKGKYNGNPESIPHGAHKTNAVKINEYDDLKKFGIVMNLASTVMLCFIAVIYCQLAGGINKISTVGLIIPFILLLPHEMLHAVCFKNEVFLYTNFKSGMLFVVGSETMSRSRAIFMALLPNIVFGVLPFMVFLIDHSHTLLGTVGGVSIAMGLGDYYNVFNIVTQSPRKARIYMYQTSTYWYIPETEEC